MATITIALVGDPFVGKSALASRLRSGALSDYSTTYTPSLGADFHTVTKVVMVDGANVTVRLKIWDTAGLERLVSVSGHTFPSVDVCVLCADVTNSQSFSNITRWHDEFCLASPYSHSPSAFVVAITKCDEGRVAASRAVSVEDAQAWAVQESVDPALYPTTPGTAMDPYPPVVDVSARDDVNINALITMIVQRGLRRQRFDAELARHPHYAPLPIPHRETDETDVNTCRMVVFGDEAPGKTLFLTASFCEDLVEDNASVETASTTSLPTLFQHTFHLNPIVSVRATAWCVPGRDKTGPLPFCKGAAVVVVVIRMGVKASVHRVQQWCELAMMEGHIRDPSSLTFALVGIRTGDYQESATDEAIEYAAAHNMTYLELPEPQDMTLLNTTLVIETILAKSREHREKYVTDCIEALCDFYMVQCQHAPEGCTWTGKTRELSQHSASCSHEKMKCRFEGCRMSFKRSERLSHEGTCAHRPQTCHLCEMPYASLHEHMIVCPKRKELEEMYVPCPMALCGCTATLLKRGEVTAHVEATTGTHMIMLTGVIQAIRVEGMVEEKNRIAMVEELRRECDRKVQTLSVALEAARKELEAERQCRKDLQVEMVLLWKAVEERRGSNPCL